MRKWIAIVFTLCCIVANICSQSPCLKPTGVPVEEDVTRLGLLGMAHCLGVRDEQAIISELNVIEHIRACNPRKMNARAAFEELKEHIQILEYMQMLSEYKQTQKEIDVIWVRGCFRIYNNPKYHEKVKEIFYKHCERCK